MDRTTASCALSLRAHRTYASVGPSAPWSTFRSTRGESRVAKARRRATQGLRRLRRRAMAAKPRPSSSTRERITRASSIGVVVRGGAFERSNRSLHSGLDRALSTTAGTTLRPWSRQRAKRLKPSTISKKPPSSGTTRIGRSWSWGCKSCGCTLRSRSRLVRSSATGIMVTSGAALCDAGSATPSAAFMAVPGSQEPVGGASRHRSRGRDGPRAGCRRDRQVESGRPFSD